MTEADPLVRVRLDISYDGTDFSGWAVQPGRRTVQGDVQDALCTVLRVPGLRLVVAGRTDAGVHASGQVAHLDLTRDVWNGSRTSLLRQLAGVLAPDVRVLAVTEVPPEFDARFGAVWRRYEYRVSDRAAGNDPLSRRSVLHWPRELDAGAMGQAARALLGLHDFAAFCRAPETGTTIRTLERFDVVRTGHLIVCTVQADAFCHSMVRSLVGAVIAVGEGRRPLEWPASLLGRERRADDVPVAPAHGLTLVEVAYPPDDQLAARTRRTRATRTPDGPTPDGPTPDGRGEPFGG